MPANACGRQEKEMTERKRKMRLKRRERRRARYKKWVLFNSIAIALIAVTIVGLYVANDRINEATYIDYVESTDVKYSVKIPKDTPFYSEYLEDFSQYADANGDLWIPTDYAYPSMAATIVRIGFDYHLEVCSPDVDYEYTYRIIAQPEVVDGATKNKFPLPKVELKKSDAPIKGNSSSELNFTENIEIDYHYYDDIVKQFEKEFDIKDATENLIVTMEVEVIGSSEKFENNAENTCTIKVTMPLNESAFDVNYSTTSSHCGDCKILCKTAEGVKGQLIDVAKVLCKVEVALIVILLVGWYISRNKDITYYTKVQRLVNSYRSFIQKIENGFDTTGYQIVIISSFREMLAIRDTIQSPILMSENTDKTRTQFFIPTNTRILYLFEVKVDNYDKLYADSPESDDSAIDTSRAVSKTAPAAVNGQNESVVIAESDPVVNAASIAHNAPVASMASGRETSASSASSVNSVSSVSGKTRRERVWTKEGSTEYVVERNPAVKAAPAARTAPVANNAPTTNARTTTCGYATASIYVEGQTVVTTTNTGCAPCKTNVNVVVGDCGNASVNCKSR